MIRGEPSARSLGLRMLLPIVWGVGCLVGAANPGDEYALFFMGSVLGAWTALIVPFSSPGAAILPVLVVGCGLMFLFGLVLDRLRVSATLWLPFYVAAAIACYQLMLGQHADFEAAVQKHGSALAYLACASQFGNGLATAAALLVGSGRYFFGLRRRNAGSVASIG